MERDGWFPNGVPEDGARFNSGIHQYTSVTMLCRRVGTDIFVPGIKTIPDVFVGESGLADGWKPEDFIKP